MQYIGTFKGLKVYKTTVKTYSQQKGNSEDIFWLTDNKDMPLVKNGRIIGYYNGQQLQEEEEPYAVWIQGAEKSEDTSEMIEEKQVYTCKTAIDFSEYSKIVDKFFEDLKV